MNWEYKAVMLLLEIDHADFTEVLNIAGKEGWELIVVMDGRGYSNLVFKRPVQQILVSEEFTTWTDESRLDNVSDP